MSDALAIGVDVGGTKIVTALIDGSGQILAEHLQSTSPEQGVGSILDHICQGIEHVGSGMDEQIIGVGIGCPGPVDRESGVSIFAANLGRGWRNINLPDEIGKRLGFQTKIFAENDVRAEALGEMHFGVAQGYDNFLYLTIGTGLGGCAITDGRPIIGSTYAAMEIGHVSLNPQGRKCTCGSRGCVEMYTSGKGLVAGVNEYRSQYPNTILTSDNLVTSDILDAARKDDALANLVIEEAQNALGVALSWSITLFNPPLVIIGGGLGHAAYDLLVEPAYKIAEERIFSDTFEKTTITQSEVTSSAVGAASLVFHHRR